MEPAVKKLSDPEISKKCQVTGKIIVMLQALKSI
jgi:hypothetical protein